MGLLKVAAAIVIGMVALTFIQELDITTRLVIGFGGGIVYYLYTLSNQIAENHARVMDMLISNSNRIQRDEYDESRRGPL